MHWYQYTKTQIEQEFATNLENGLSAGEAKSRFLKYGPNLLPESPPERWFSIFFRQFKSPLIYILLAAACIVYALGDHEDGYIILGVLTFNALIGTIQEGRSQQALRSLKQLSSVECTIIREGVEEVVAESEVVPGDVLVLREGQKVGADARVLYSSNLSVDEAALTGESGAVHKTEGNLSDSDLSASAQKNMVFKGTEVLSGDGKAVVVGTGLNTEIGKISKALLEPQEDIPLQKNIKRLARVIVFAVLGMSVLIFLLGIFSGKPPAEMFSVVVSLAVSMTPEGLPLVLTLILVTGVFRMSKRNALVKKLQAVEALGQAQVIAVDKTGTITRNEMVVKKLFAGDRVYLVEGNGYEPKGKIFLGGAVQSIVGDLETAGKIAVMSVKASVSFQEKIGQFKVLGDPTEAALNVFGEKLSFFRDNLSKEYQELAEIPFDYKTKFRAVFYGVSHRGSPKSKGFGGGNDGVLCAIAGAPEVLLAKAEKYAMGGQNHHLTQEAKKKFDSALEEFSQEGLRVVAFGFKHLTRSHPFDNIDGLVIGGFFAIEDSVRPEAKNAVIEAQKAGVKVVMITGDHKITARAIAREAGIYKEGDEIITGAELAAMSHEELAGKLGVVSVFARVTPDDKMKIIRAYKHKGLVVAMTGDGVNDAPSLVAADLGVAMGKIGTEVAKEAADIVLLDDNLSSIVAAIEEGRSMYRNIQKALLYLFSTSAGEAFTIAGALILGWPLPLLAVQILWLNVITDPLIGTSMALDKKEPGILERPFKKPSGYFIDANMASQMFLTAIVMSAATLYLFNLYSLFDYYKAVTVSLTALAVSQWYRGFNCMLMDTTIFSRQIFRNVYLWLAILLNLSFHLSAIYIPAMQKFLKTTPLEFSDWVLIVPFAFVVVLAEELRKLAVKIYTIRKLKAHGTVN